MLYNPLEVNPEQICFETLIIESPHETSEQERILVKLSGPKERENSPKLQTSFGVREGLT